MLAGHDPAASLCRRNFAECEVRLTTVCCLTPGMDEFTPTAPSASHSLGTLLVARGGGSRLELFAELVRQWRASPWCPTALCSIAPISTTAVDVLRPPEMNVVTLTQLGANAACTPSTVRTAVRHRRIPDVMDVAAYLAFRSSIGLAVLFRSVLESPDAAAMREPLRDVGPWLPHDWRAVYQCVILIAWAIGKDETEASAAEWAHVDVKTVSNWCHRYFGATWRDIVGLAAWEPVVEVALRRGGYVATR